MNKHWYTACIALLILGLLVRQPLILLVALLALLILFTTDIWLRYCLHALHFEHELSEKRALFGETITFSCMIENAKLLPLPWLEIADTIPGALIFRGRQLRTQLSSNRAMLESLFSLRWYERITRHYTVQCRARGVHTFGPTIIRSGDLFGFGERHETIENRSYLIVYPLIMPLSSFQIPARYPFGDRRAPRRLLEDPSRVIGVRDYIYGDDLRRVHWKATARTMTLQSKVYEATTTYTLVLFLNVATQLDMYFGIHPELQELSICAAASVADWALNEGYAVGLYANSMMYRPETGMSLPDSQDSRASNLAAAQEMSLAKQLHHRRIQIPPASTEEQRKYIMEALARIQGFFGSSIEELIRRERAHLPAGATVVVITSTISDPLLDTLNRLKQGGHSVAILMVGDNPVASRLAGITVYHIGGEETWKKLLAGYNFSTGEMGTEQQSGEVPVTGFRL